jgi:Domain of unknown function (DUF4145)
MAIRTCGYCGLKRAQLREVNTDVSYYAISGSTINQSILQCPDCGRMTIVEHNSKGQKPDQEIGSYPANEDLGHSIRHLPEDVDQYYSDARRVLDAGVPDAAAVQLRRTLEAAAAHFDVRERNLVASIRTLIDEGLVTRQFGEALDHIREVGNLGAHATDQRVDEVAAQRVMNFTTLLLRNLFEVPGELALASSDRGEADESDRGT